MEAQNAIRNANILLVNVKALGNEIAKNLVLAGISSLAISDPSPVTGEDLGAQFFIREDDIGKPRDQAALPRIQKMNNRVKVSILPTDPLTENDPSYLEPFSIVIATDLPIASLNHLNTACRFSQKPFYCGGSHGLYGYMFADLIQHTFSIEREPSNMSIAQGTAETPTRTIVSVMRVDKGDQKKELVTKTEMYQPLILVNMAPLPAAVKSSRRRMKAVPPLLPCLRALWEFENNHQGVGPLNDNQDDIKEFTTFAMQKSTELGLHENLKGEFLRSFLQCAYQELAPTSAFVGAALAQDVINVLGGREQPCQNIMLFDGEEGRAEFLPLVPEVTTQAMAISEST